MQKVLCRPEANWGRRLASMNYLSELEREYKARVAPLANLPPQEGKDRYEAEMLQAQKLFIERVGDDEVAQKRLIAAILMVPDNGFAHIALCQLIELLARQEMRDKLVEVLSKRCPSKFGLHMGVEDYLIILRNKELKEGTLILCDAFEKATDEDARHSLADAIRRGFKFAGITSTDDTQVVDQCRRWFSTNYRAYEPNTRYLGHFNQSKFPYDTEGVLVTKREAERRRNTLKDTTLPPGQPQ
ncbi:MAG: hypothetical protein QM778_00435 [Myxococcales bacterium]